MAKANGTRGRGKKQSSDRTPLLVAGVVVIGVILIAVFYPSAEEKPRRKISSAEDANSEAEPPSVPVVADEPEAEVLPPEEPPEPEAPSVPEVTFDEIDEDASTDEVTYYHTDEEFVGPFPSWRNVKTDYGAVGDGKADDTAAIQKALNEMKAVQTNDWSVLYFPAGTYRITAMLTTKREAHNDYLGSNIIGEDPATTILWWDGPDDMSMFRWDSWYCRVARLTFDGRGKAAGGLLRAGGFATYCEHSDLVFKDIKGIALNLGNNEPNGIAETAILRCKFIRCGEGISTIQWNTLDIYIWYCLFEDCGKGVYNRMGGYQAYENAFLRSKEFDVGSMNNMVAAFVNNTSIGSKTFLQGIGQYVRGNKIYNTTDSVAIQVGSNLIMLDNLIVSRPGAAGAAAYCGSSTTAIGNTYTVDWPLRPVHYPHPNAANLRRDLDRALDNNPATEFVDGGCNNANNAPHPSSPLTVQWNAPEGGAKTVASYTLTSGSNPQLDPQDFQFLGSELAGGPWTVLDAQKNVKFENRCEKKVFSIKEPAAYPVFRLAATANSSGTPRMSLAEVQFLDEEGNDITRDTDCLITGRNEKWGTFCSLDQTIANRADVEVPAKVRLPGTPRNHKRKVFEVARGTGDDSKELQRQIDAAAKEPAGSNPVVHVPKGIYTLKRTVTVPALCQMQLVGDGVGNGTLLNYGGGFAGPMLRLAGPSRATLRDLEARSPGTQGVDSLVIENADQDGGSVYTEQLLTGGNGNDRCGAAVYVDGLDKSDVTMICGGFTSFLAGVKVRGGPILAGGGKTKNQVVFICGGTGGGCRLLDVADGGRVVGETFWYEADWDYPAALMDLPSTASGRITLAGAAWHMNTLLQPIVSVDGFDGFCTILGSQIDAMNVNATEPCVRLTGDGSKATLVGIGSWLTKSGAGAWPIETGWIDRTKPAARTAILGCNGAVATNRQMGVMPDAALVRRSLDQIRAVRIAPPQNRPEGVTDVKLFRVSFCAGAGKDAIRIGAGAEQ